MKTIKMKYLCTIISCLVSISCLLAVSEADDSQSVHIVPQTGDSVQRIAVGRSVKFRCLVNNLGRHKVAWFFKDAPLLLAVDNTTVAWKDRIHASTPASGVFELQIDRVQLSDKGNYTCQLPATRPLQSQLHILDVLRPPQIKEEETTITVEPVKEFSPAELRCVADGIPKPMIKWRRESQMHVLPSSDEDYTDPDTGADTQVANGNIDIQRQQTGDNSNTNDARKVAPRSVKSITVHNHEEQDRLDVNSSPMEATTANTSNYQGLSLSLGTGLNKRSSDPDSPTAVQIGNKSSLYSQASLPVNPSKMFIGEGEILRIEKTSRYDMGFYMCIASNGVPPSVSQRIFLPVSFAHSKSSSTRTPSSALATRPGSVIDHASSVDMVGSPEGSKQTTITWLPNGQPPGRSSQPDQPKWRSHDKNYRKHQQRTAATSTPASSLKPSPSSSAPMMIINSSLGAFTCVLVNWLYRLYIAVR